MKGGQEKKGFIYHIDPDYYKKGLSITLIQTTIKKVDKLSRLDRLWNLAMPWTLILPTHFSVALGIYILEI